MNTLKILKPLKCASVYDIAAAEFQKIYSAITKNILPIITEDDGTSDLIVIGSDAVNPFTAELILENRFSRFQMHYTTDDYNVCSAEYGSRKFLLVAGGRGRSTLYAVYDFFEKYGDCRYFWDGDILPATENIDITGISIISSPRFEYRGIRYFAHRGLHRFQAEHWSLEDWKQEIDWMLKKRLNLFMLRIGNDDLFQKAFPDIVDYPSHTEKLCDGKDGFDDRTSAWPLEYRGWLRKQVLAYAFKRDLMHPEDCGTTTHWYTPTPKQFLKKVKPKMFAQSDKNYTAQETLVWDIYDEKNMENYFKLTETHIKEYGKPDLFHTIGFAERTFSDDKEKNLKMKLYIYRKIANYLKEHYPNAPLFIASWDIWMFYTSQEAKQLISELDPNQSVILDYTSDTMRASNFTNWGVVGKFPYIFGIFQGYSPNSDIRGNYSLTEKRLAISANDSYCKGMVLWPELSHSDTFMTEYLSQNAWSPLSLTMDQRIEKYCRDRYRRSAGILTDVWKKFMPIVSLMSWSMDSTVYNTRELFTIPFSVIDSIKNGNDCLKGFDLEHAKSLIQDAADILNDLKDLDKETLSDNFIRRDVYDISRTILGRYIHVGLLTTVSHVREWIQGEDMDAQLFDDCQICMNLMNLLAELLGGHEDYSMYAALIKLKNVQPVNPIFEETLKQNSSCGYNRSYVYENTKMLYIPEMQMLFDWLKKNVEEGNRKNMLYTEKYKQMQTDNFNRYLNSSLEEMSKHEQREISSILYDISNEIQRLKDIPTMMPSNFPMQK